MSGIIINEDCNHYLYARYNAGVQVTEKELLEFVDQYQGTQVSHFFLNMNGMNAWYPSKVRANVIDRYARAKAENWPNPENWAYMGIAYDLYVNQGLDMYKIWIERFRHIGISPWISIRTNDIHNTDDDLHPLQSDFFVQNKHMRRATPYRPASLYEDHALCYEYAEVRQNYLDMIQELLDNYDCDGLEMDWMREIYLLRVGREPQGMHLITQIMRDVRAMLNNAAKKFNRTKKLAVRMPPTAETALRYGLDVLTWAQEGLIDLVIPTPRWSSCDSDMPIDLWRRMMDPYQVEVAAGIEILVEATNGEPLGKKCFMNSSVETTRGFAAQYFDLGSKYLYTFNYMDIVTQPEPGSRLEWSTTEPRTHREFLNTCGSAETALAHPRRHMVTIRDMVGPGQPKGQLLPLELPAAKDGRITIRQARLATGPALDKQRIRFIAGIAQGTAFAADDLAIWASGIACTSFLGKVTLPRPFNPALDYYAYEIPNDGTFSPQTVLELAATKQALLLEWLEIDIR